MTFIGSDFVEEGRKAAKQLLDRVARNRPAINVVELQGTVGSWLRAIDRKKGFEEVIKSNAKIQIIRSQSGDFTRARGKEVGCESLP